MTQAPAKSPAPTIQSLLISQKAQIAAALPKHLTADRMARIALTELRRNPRLQQCDPLSFLGAIICAAQLGLEPGSALGHCYLIPYKNECQLQIGYRGMVDLARRSGGIEWIDAAVIREGDEWWMKRGTTHELFHQPKFQNGAKVTHIYAVAKLKGGGHQFDVMSVEEVLDIRDRYSMGYKRDPKSSPWTTAPEEMLKKTLVRRIFKMLPTSIEMRQAVEVDEDDDQANHKIIDAAYEIPLPTPDPERFAEISGAKDQPMAAEASADKKNAIAELVKAVNGVIKASGKPNEILGTDVAPVLAGKTAHGADEIINMADRLSAWEPK